MDVFKIGETEVIVVNDTTASGSTPHLYGGIVRVISTASIFVTLDGDATQDACYLPYNGELFLSIAKGDVISLLAEAGTPAGHKVYLTAVKRALI